MFACIRTASGRCATPKNDGAHSELRRPNDAASCSWPSAGPSSAFSLIARLTQLTLLKTCTIPTFCEPVGHDFQKQVIFGRRARSVGERTKDQYSIFEQFRLSPSSFLPSRSYHSNHQSVPQIESISLPVFVMMWKPHRFSIHPEKQLT